MGLLGMLRKLKLKEKEMRILFLGLDNAGKSSVIKAFLGESIDELSPTLGFEIRTIETQGYRINCWDVGGQTTIRAYWRNYFETTDGIVWVVDSTDRNRIPDCKKELDSVLQQERLAGASLLIFANKQDINGAMKPEEIAQLLDLNAINKRHWSIQKCSAKSREGIENGFNWIIEDIGSRLFTHP
ncbi:ADP-ribosylation factor At2g18390, putative [Trichomonas vaginalis G3]|uniref:ADP-ribosylation factor-like protein 2 n=1 Tax=Trichomonas vaginalis (strain ATCC PRA-98 / G3) TaxID=412133 RepID=A2DUD4_TRIV3|nr:GTP binding [Trichomonas vaginalis G3]EAY15972.1 ADP-ribosylation factor At2g18390, putative [Trichomonas vaginalis G3]KAI5523607.1 GTP binding [Trichomonas vaginalis G3]|eukprot:XP_001328195.1 ADP-ribosylation factor At2g18390 [Trichomonas vaginalis G3]